MWPPSEFWAANVHDVIDASEGWAVEKGLKKKFNPADYPSRKDREELHRKLIEKHGHA